MTPQDIQREHDRLGYGLGWRFLTGPAFNLTQARVAIVTLNPGGARNIETSDAERWSSERGNAYCVESWGASAPGLDPFQVQIKRLAMLLQVRLSETLSAHFVPFRSPDWKSLTRREEAAVFGLRLWRWALAQSPAETIVCIGQHVAGEGIASALKAAPVASAPAGWGDLTIHRYRAPDGRRVLALPHLGRFRLFGRVARDDLFLKALEF